MAIVPLRKLTLYGRSPQKQDLLARLQRLGCVHPVSLQDADAGDSSHEATLDFISREAKEAYRYLHQAPVRRRPASNTADFDREGLIKELLAIKHRRTALRAERDELVEAIETVTPWGDFKLPDTADLGGLALYFYRVPLRDQSQLPSDAAIWETVATDNRFAYVVAISDRDPGWEFERIEPDRRSLGELRRRLEQVDEELEEKRWQRITLTRWIDALRAELDAADDQAARRIAADGMRDDRGVFAMQGWIPLEAADEVRSLAEEFNLAVTMESPGRSDLPPTLLKNPERIAGAEGCITFYITPGYTTWDPTTVVFFSFSLFFAMIVSDAGYGLVMALLLAAGWKRLGRDRRTTRFRNLLVAIATATILYGVLAGSYFGVAPAPGSLPDRLRVRVAGEPITENQNAMMLLSVVIGVVHLVVGNVFSAIGSRLRPSRLGHLGWAVLMVAALVVGIGQYEESTTTTQLGISLAVFGGVVVLLLSSDRPLWTADPRVHAMRLLDGVMQVGNVTKAFGDVLSYLRLFALGLASAQLAITFNELAGDAFRHGAIGILLAMVILAVGHGINFLLGVMGGVVHGLRLNCIEFFNWGLDQEGYPFRPFKTKASR